MLRLRIPVLISFSMVNWRLQVVCLFLVWFKKIQIYVLVESHVILHRSCIEPIAWNFDSLRRYGHDEVYFSFESGRRCVTGQGIFSFRCARPEIVFQRLESVIKGRNAIEPNNHPNDIFVTPNVNGRSIAQLNCQNAGGGQP